MGYRGWDELEGFVDFGLGGEAGEREAYGGACAGGAEAHGGEDVRWCGGSGGAGAASADAKAFEVKCDDEGFGFEVVEVNAGGVGGAGCADAVDAALVDAGQDALLEAVSEGR